MSTSALQLLYALLTAASCLIAMRGLVHYFQLESYQFPGYRRTLARNRKRALLPGALLAVLHIPAVLAVKGIGVVGLIIAAVLLIGGAWLIRSRTRDRKAKKPLVVTARVKRLYGVSAVVLFVTALLWLRAFGWIGAFVYPLLLPGWVALCGLLAWPIEKLISEMYFRDAQRKLRSHKDLIRIGITGSYGKTSVKFILGTMLSEKYQTLITPSSFNTPMGVTRIIREKLQPSHQVFVAEMGARHVGDIREMCRLVHPTYGVLTSVGPQHLDTFRTLERIKNTKYELIDAIPADGVGFFPDDGAICAELYGRTTGKPRRLCSLKKTEQADVWAEDIRVTPQGSEFTLCTKGDSVACHTRMLGEHNIQNILLAATVCLELGLTLQQVSRGIAKVEPVEHRLQLLPSGGGITIIDDAFNSNPNGAKAALKVLSQFPARRIIITPGMVELGAGEDEFNRAFGESMADAADIAILVGKKHVQPIADGLKAKGFKTENIHIAASLDEAARILGRIGRAGDTALFENDLPDNYTES